LGVFNTDYSMGLPFWATLQNENQSRTNHQGVRTACEQALYYAVVSCVGGWYIFVSPCGYGPTSPTWD